MRCLRYLLLSMFVLSVSSYYLGATSFPISDPGKEEIVDYSKYGEFIGVGTGKYKYKISNKAGLKVAVGEGVFPNVTSVLRDPAYKKFKKEGKLEGNQWNFVNTQNYQLNFLKWATVMDDPAIKLYYAALALERSGNIKHAIKAYYAIVVHFPKAAGRTYWGSPWYLGPVALAKIQYLTRLYPQLGMRVVGAYVYVKNSFDNARGNDVFIVDPGKIVLAKARDFVERKVDLSKFNVVETKGTGKVKLKKYENKHWQLLVNDKPYVIKGMAYSPNKVGLSPDAGTLNVSRDWMYADFNQNGIIDGPYESFVDWNNNNIRDDNEKDIGDFKLMQDMGVNTLRLYHHSDFNKELLRDGYEKYGFMYIMGDFLGMYAAGSEAEWYYGTDYTDPEHKKNMLESVRKMVEEYKDEPYILMWLLGNENNYGGPGVPGITTGSGCRAKIQPNEYYAFVNEAAKLIKKLDPQKRPVAICNGDTLYLDICAEKAPELDIFGCNAYRGEQGFTTLWWDVKDVYDRPVFITEYGCSAHHRSWPVKKAELAQAAYHRGNWYDIETNLAGMGEGNALGGIVFEWTDEWWKAGPPPEFDPSVQDKVGQFGAPFLDGWSYEELLGVTTQGDGSLSPFYRRLRPSYFAYREMWKDNVKPAKAKKAKKIRKSKVKKKTVKGKKAVKRK